MRNIKLTIEYDGSRFFGFQRQKDRPTLQGEIEKALSRLFSRPMKIAAAAGRTDSGVHALAQVVNFRTDSLLPTEKIRMALNAFLPREVAVKKVEEVPPGFHARYGARWKTYEYLVWNSRVRAPLLDGRALQYPYKLDLQAMRRAARRLVGRRDFKVFQAAGSSVKTSVRTVRRLTIKREGDLLRFSVEADGFLYHMVRNIVGTLLETGRGKLKNVLAGGGPNLPGRGLTLVAVRY